VLSAYCLYVKFGTCNFLSIPYLPTHIIHKKVFTEKDNNKLPNLTLNADKNEYNKNLNFV